MSLTRRHFLYGSLALPAFAAKTASEQPNIVVILADGVGAWLLGCYGNKEVQTPNIDSIAANGTRFLNHYASAPVAAAGREGLLTGGGSNSIDKTLSAAGYNCETTNTGAEAVRYISSQPGTKPFILTAGLAPYQAAPESKYLAAFAHSNFETWPHEPPSPNAARNQQMMGRDLIVNLRRVGGQTMALDDQVGAITLALAQKKVTDRTLLVFTSTCGGLFGAHGLWGDGEASNPVNMYEEVVNTPMLWMWPGRVPPRAVRPEMISATDFLPTICVVTGANLPSNNLAGRSYASLSTGVPLPKKQPWKTTVFARHRNTSMVRTDRYKLVLRDNGAGPGELYDDKQDPHERVNQYDNPQFMTVKSSLRAAKP
jgi:arylsulfatase A-like enzyme